MVEDIGAVQEEEEEESTAAVDESSKPCPGSKHVRTNNDEEGQPPNSMLVLAKQAPQQLQSGTVAIETSTTMGQSTRTPKHAKVSREASLKSQNSMDNGYSTPPGERMVGSFKRVRSGTRPGSMTGNHSRQSSDISVRKTSDGNLLMGSSLEVQRRKSSLTVYRTISTGYETEDEGNIYYSTSRPEWGFDQIAMQSDSDSDLEFFDAKGTCIHSALSITCTCM